MRVRGLVLLVGALATLGLACTETAPDLPTQDKGWLVLFKRVTFATDTPGLAEIEIEVRTGAHLTAPAPDGTKVLVDTTSGRFEGDGTTMEVTTNAGRAVLMLILHQPSGTTLTAKVHHAEARLTIDIDDRGKVKIGPS